MQIKLESHAYAPELNRAFIRPNKRAPWTVIRAAGCKSIKEVRAHLFAPLAHSGCRVITVRKFYDNNGGHLNIKPDFRAGRATYQEALALKRQWAGMNPGGAVLFDGSIMPPPRFSITARLYG